MFILGFFSSDMLSYFRRTNITKKKEIANNFNIIVKNENSVRRNLLMAFLIGIKYFNLIWMFEREEKKESIHIFYLFYIYFLVSYIQRIKRKQSIFSCFLVYINYLLKKNTPNMYNKRQKEIPSLFFCYFEDREIYSFL